jgi:hypothetical protein
MLSMKNIIKKISAVAMAFALLGAGTTVVKNVNPNSVNTLTASAAYSTRYTYYTTASDLQIRQGPGTSYGLVGSGYNRFVKQYRTFHVNQVRGNWGYSTDLVNANNYGTSGWVCLSYCRYY